MKQDTSKELKTLGNGVAEKDRYALEFVNVTKSYAEVTDGKMLIRHKIMSPAIKIELKDKKNVLISPVLLSGKESMVTINDLTMDAVDGAKSFSANHPKEIEYPATDAVLREAKAEKTVIRIGLNRKLLLKVLKSIPEDGTYENEVIILEFKAPDKAVYFKTGGTEGLILPVRLDEEAKDATS